MITEVGRVVAVEGQAVWVQTIRQSACQSCSARQGCGQRVLASISGGKANQVLVENTLGARLGDEVTLAIAESALLGASLWVYALPLVLLVAGAVVAQWFVPESELAAILGAVLGMVTGFTAAKAHNRDNGQRYAPRLVGVRTLSELSLSPTDL